MLYLTFDRNTGIIKNASQVNDLLGYTEQELCLLDTSVLFSKQSTIVNEVLKGKRVNNHFASCHSKSGEILKISYSLFPQVNKKGDTNDVLCIADLKRDYEFDFFQDNMLNHFHNVDKNNFDTYNLKSMIYVLHVTNSKEGNRFIYASKAAWNIFEIDPNLIVKYPNLLWETVIEEDLWQGVAPEVFKIRSVKTKTLKTIHRESIVFKRQDGSKLVYGVFSDISEASDIKKSLEKEQYDIILDCVPAPAVIHSLDGKIIQGNQRIKDLLSPILDSPEKVNILDIIIDKQQYSTFLTRIEVLKEANFNCSIKPSESVKLEMNVRLKLLKHSGAYYALTVFTPLAENTLLKSIEKNGDASRVLLRNIPFLLIGFNKNCKVHTWNKECEKVTGYLAEEIKNIPNIWEVLYPDKKYREEIDKQWNKNHGFYSNSEYEITRKDGEKRIILFSDISAKFPVPGWASWMVGVDITEQKKLQAKLSRFQKLEAMETLAGGVAHDLNNMLTVILGYTELTLNSLNEKSKESDRMKIVLETGNKARDLVFQLLMCSRKQKSDLKKLKLTEVIKEIMPIVHAGIPSTIQIKEHIADDCGEIFGEKTQIHQIVMNLCTNASKAIDGHGVIKVLLEQFELKDPLETFNGIIPQGPYAKLVITDTGDGIDPKTMTRIFDPFFTTHKQGEGTGLGLSIVIGIVQHHNGGILVDSQLAHSSPLHIVTA